MNLISKYKNMGTPTKAALWFAFCSILQKGIAFITVPLFTRLLSTQEYGIYSLYLSWFQLLSIVTSLYIYNGVFNNGMIKFEEDRDRFISSMLGLTLTINTIVFCFFLAFQNIWSSVLGLSQLVIFFMFIEMGVSPALAYWSGRQRFEYKYIRMVIVTIFASIMNPVLGLIAVYFSSDHATARIASVVLSEVIVCGIIMVFQFSRGKCFFNKKYWKYSITLAIPLLPHYLSGMILNQGDRIMIDKMVGKSEVALYSIAYSIGMLAQIATSSINSSFTPWMYQKLKNKDYKDIKQIINVLLIIVSFIIILLIMLAPELIWIFGSKEYADAVYVIPPVAASVFFIFLYNLLAIPQFYFEKPHFLMISSIIAAVANLILNYVFIKIYGYVAAGYTTLVCYVMYSVGHYIISTKIIKAEVRNEMIYDSKGILYISLLVISIGITSNFLFPYPMIRYGIIVLIFLLIFSRRRQIFVFFQRMSIR